MLPATPIEHDEEGDPGADHDPAMTDGVTSETFEHESRVRYAPLGGHVARGFRRVMCHIRSHVVSRPGAPFDLSQVDTVDTAPV